METLAVIAYKQPVTRGEIEAIRGVKCDYSVQSLVNKRLICEVGRKETLGRPSSTARRTNFSGISAYPRLMNCPGGLQRG